MKNLKIPKMVESSRCEGCQNSGTDGSGQRSARRQYCLQWTGGRRCPRPCWPGVLSILTSIAGLPEVSTENKDK